MVLAENILHGVHSLRGNSPGILARLYEVGLFYLNGYDTKLLSKPMFYRQIFSWKYKQPLQIANDAWAIGSWANTSILNVILKQVL
jgi:hypothetical protein